MRKIISFVLIIGLLLFLCACSAGNQADDKFVGNQADDKFVGTWKCDEWIGFNGDVEKNAKIVLKSDGSGTILRGERWATFCLTWEKLDEDTIMIYAENDDGGVTCYEYSYELIDGIAHLIFDNGRATQDFYKQ